jgi:hypothetical protein
MARPRLRAALLAGAVLATALPVLAHATATHLGCNVKLTNRWERIPVSQFQPINGIGASATDTIASYTVDGQRTQDVAATNGYSVQLSNSHGCAWSTAYELSATPTAAQPFAGAASRIVSVALLSGRAMAAVQEGSGSASRPHVVVSRTGAAGSWAASDSGLPAQGAPQLLRAAADGRTAYLTVSPTASGGGGGVIPGLPGGGPTGTPTGFLYRTTDGGASWTLQTGAADLPGGGTGFSHLTIDPSDSNRLYGIVGGRLLTSRDGGGTFTAAPGSGFTAITAMSPLTFAAFNASGGVLSNNGGASYLHFPAPSGITSAAARGSEAQLAIEVSGALKLLQPDGSVTNIPAVAPARPGSLLGDRGPQSTFHALAGHSLLRYVDPVPPGVIVPPLPIGSLEVPPPRPGVVTPATRNVTLPIGSSSVEDFTLTLPKNPTPLDLFFLVDVSTSMGDYIQDLKANIRGIVARLEAAKVDLRVGVGLLGTGPAKGESEYPPTYVYSPTPDPDHPGQSTPGPTYVKPVLYKRLRQIGQTGASLQAAINRLALETVPLDKSGTNNHEGQLIALKNMVNGRGTHTEAEAAANLPTYSNVPPGQEAGFRPNPGVRRVVILATNEPMDAPFGYPREMGTDERPGSDAHGGNPLLNFKPTIDLLVANRIQLIGLTAGVPEAINDLQILARGTRSLTPPGGVACGGDPPQQLLQGEPLVCNNGDKFGAMISRVLASLVDRQSIRVVPHSRTPVLGALNGRALTGLDVKQPNRAGFQVRVNCIDVKPGRYSQLVDLYLRQTIVGRARVNVTCVQSNSVVRPRPITGADPPVPPAQPLPNAVPPPAPPPPAAQPQVQPQVQTQVQVQPLTAAAIQEQQELQLALALNGTYKEDDPAFNAGQQMAMVDRRRRQEVQALGLLAFAILTCAGLGLAGLRARPEVRVRRAR